MEWMLQYFILYHQIFEYLLTELASVRRDDYGKETQMDLLLPMEGFERKPLSPLGSFYHMFFIQFYTTQNFW